MSAVRIGVGGPVGSGKTRLLERLLPLLHADGLRVAVITNDLVTHANASFHLDAPRPVAVIRIINNPSHAFCIEDEP